MIDFCRSSSRKRHMRPDQVVPLHEAQDFQAHIAKSEGHKDAPKSFFFRGPNETFHEGNASMFANGPVARFYAMERTPLAKFVTEPSAAP